MAKRSFYVLSNDATGTESRYDTLDAALDAVEETVGAREHWEIHEFLSDSIARWITDGRGRSTSFQVTSH
jgi:hypothetical protein